MIRGFLFDLDGVLTDTSEYHYLAWKRLADELGIPFNRQENEALRGVSRRESLLLLLKGRPASEEQMNAWMELKNQFYIQFIQQMTPTSLLPGARELLEELRQGGYLSAIVSSSKNTPLVLERLQIAPLFDAIVDGNTPVRSKPAPDLFLLAARKLSLLPAECVVVEDAAAGIDAGKAAGMRTIGLGPRERVGHADLVLPDLQQVHLAEILTRLG
ncbi:MAG TPA: beta-phosphoglucomutase [Anaerolinea thermolimosa]|uniref:Beta-phosphoglucomutase n=1 Tax=Anaerolinea thermolimosa TaxID=229919 RepID=A0A3D1JE57_9CHLR|nr:beta-phosphoglucomutase [Anaerolinea thermolimosa]GAP07566.1 beta-phosphoglucomutase [Anaerolinea thermolimosa]HCE16704.1 beta-phosphoglucomutase [Anaerolinea thermolimosa]